MTAYQIVLAVHLHLQCSHYVASTEMINKNDYLILQICKYKE